MEKRIKQQKICNVIMLVVSAIVCVMAGMYAATGTLPFGMDQKSGNDAVFVLIGLLLMALFYIVQTVLGFLTVKDHKNGTSCNVMGIFTWVLSVIMFLAVFGDDPADWIMLFVLIFPAALHAAVAQKIAHE